MKVRLTPPDKGTIFGRWTVISSPEHLEKIRGVWRVECLCTCGNKGWVSLGSLLRGQSMSCGCARRDNEKIKQTCRDNAEKNVTHGQYGTPEYGVWRDMKQRCNNRRNKAYPNYGGRGIKVCTRWNSSYLAFISDVGSRPSSEHSIERIDVNGDYAPENVKWALWDVQMNNRRNNQRVNGDGQITTVIQRVRQLLEGDNTVSVSTAVERVVRRGYSVEDAVRIQLHQGIPDDSVRIRRSNDSVS